MRHFAIIAALAAAFISASSCGKVEQPFSGEYRSVLIYYGMGYNNLSGDLLRNVNVMTEGDVPAISSDRALLIFNHNTSRYGDYTTPTEPTLTHVYTRNGEVVKDTLIRYPSNSISASGQMMRSVLEDVRRKFPSKSYGMMLSSHAKGWVPPGYSTNSEYQYSLQPQAIGAQYEKTASNCHEIETAEFAASFPMKMDYIIMDACLSSCVEIAYQLRNVCGTLIASPTEVLSQGFVYKPVCEHLLGEGKPDLKAICTDYFDYYNSLSGDYRSATIAMIDCAATEGLAAVCKDIFSRHRDAIKRIDTNKVQKYFYNSLRWFYDLRDFAAAAGADGSELASLDAALEKCVLYHDETPSFLGSSLKLERCCGLSIYIPNQSWNKLNTYYRTLDWNKATGLVE